MPPPIAPAIAKYRRPGFIVSPPSSEIVRRRVSGVIPQRWRRQWMCRYRLGMVV
jgi:hypothetical protein